KRYRQAFAAASARVSTREEAAVHARAEAGEPYPKTIMDTFFSGWLKIVTKIPLLTSIVMPGGLALFATPATPLHRALATGGQPAPPAPPPSPSPPCPPRATRRRAPRHGRPTISSTSTSAPASTAR